MTGRRELHEDMAIAEASVRGRRVAGQTASDPPCYAILGRQAFSSMVMPWHLLAQRLARRHPVAYVLDPERPLRRILGLHESADPPGVRVVAPIEFPLQRFRAVRRACHASAARRVRSSLSGARGPIVTILYPYSSVETARELRADLVVYVATDDYASTDPRFPAWESQALELAQLVVPIADVLAVRLRGLGHPRIRVIPAAFDDEAYATAGGPAAAPPTVLPRPLLGFAGTVRASRLDLETIETVAKMRPGWGFAFFGPVIEERSGELDRLRSLPNVRFLACAGASEVPALIAAFDVVMCPYRDLPFNRGYYPMKVLDALAAGRAVVAAPWSDLRELHPHVLFVRDADSFVHAVETQLAAGNGADAVAARRAAVAPRSFTNWTRTFEEEVAAALRECSA